MLGEKSLQVSDASFEVLEILHGRQPRRQLGPVVVGSKPPVEQQNRPEVVLVPDDTPHRLIDGTKGLQVVPLVPAEAPSRPGLLPVQVLFLQADFGVKDAGVGDAGDDDGAGVSVGKVDALRDLSSADGQEASSNPRDVTNFGSIPLMKEI